MSKTSSKKDIERDLKTIYQAAELPGGIDFTIDCRTLYVFINNPSLNMQKDGAAFEAWIIMLKSHLDIETVVLDFNTVVIKKDIHAYNRFLWRVSNFGKMYSWFDIEHSKIQIIKDFLKNEFVDLKVNKPSVIRPAVTNSSGERYVEWIFASQTPNTLKKILGCNMIVNQFPVGVFNNKVTNSTKIFTGGASAIDLLGIDELNGVLHLIELKKSDNSSIGIISEYLFYIFVLYNIFISKDIMYESGAIVVPEFEKLRGMQLNKIQGHLLAEKFHPLIDDKTMYLLNSGLNGILRIITDRISYSFDQITSTISEVEFI